MKLSKKGIKVEEDLYLKPWSIKFAGELFKLTDQNREYLQPWLSWVPGVKTEADSNKFIYGAIKERKKDTGLDMGIWLKNSLVGCIGLHAISLSNHRASIGYWLSKDYQKQGIMTRSTQALIDYSFNTLNLNRIALEICIENTSSCAVAERLGFIKEGIHRQFEFVDGRYLDMQVYSLLKSDIAKFIK